MKVYIVETISEEYGFDQTEIVRAFDSEEKVKDFIRKNTREEDPKPYYLYTAVKNDKDIGGYSYYVLDVE